MSTFSDSIFKKLDKIPAAPNFVRYNFDDLTKTLKAYVAFAKGMPTVSYVAGIKIVRDLVLGWTSPEQAMITARQLKNSPSRAPIIQFVDAFCEYTAGRDFQGIPAFSDFSTSFAPGRNLFVPVKPTVVSREAGKFRPTFVFGWKSVPLNSFQRRLLMTILEDAIFSLTDFQDSDADIIFLPEIEGVRQPEVWNRGDYELLSQGQLRDQMELFLEARELAHPIITEWLLSRKTEMVEERPTSGIDTHPQLDLWSPSADR